MVSNLRARHCAARRNPNHEDEIVEYWKSEEELTKQEIVRVSVV
jgi:hypothetical protein